MRALIVIAFLALAALHNQAAHAATFRTLPAMLVLSFEESQAMMRKEYITQALEAGKITQAQAEDMQDAEMASYVLEDGAWGIMIVPRDQPSQ